MPADPAPAKGCTPGPWTLTLRKDGTLHIGSPSVMHTIIDTQYPGPAILSEGDAALIAAAPALRDACAAALMYAEYYEGENGEEGRMLRDKLRAALRRAQGGAP